MSYNVWVDPQALADAKAAPGNIRTGDWRVVYAVSDSAQWVWVLAVRKRPPYDYGDLEQLLATIES